MTNDWRKTMAKLLIIRIYPYTTIIIYTVRKRLHRDLHPAVATTDTTAAEPIARETRHGRDCRPVVVDAASKRRSRSRRE